MYARRLLQAGVLVVHRVAQGLDHFGILKPMAGPGDPALSWIVEPLRRPS